MNPDFQTAPDKTILCQACNPITRTSHCYGFVEFKRRGCANRALESLNGESSDRLRPSLSSPLKDGASKRTKDSPSADKDQKQRRERSIQQHVRLLLMTQKPTPVRVARKHDHDLADGFSDAILEQRYGSSLHNPEFSTELNAPTRFAKPNTLEHRCRSMPVQVAQ